MRAMKVGRLRVQREISAGIETIMESFDERTVMGGVPPARGVKVTVTEVVEVKSVWVFT